MLSPNWKDGRIDTIPKLKEEGDGVEISVAPEHARARKMPVRRQVFGARACSMLDFSFSSMLEPA